MLDVPLFNRNNVTNRLLSEFGYSFYLIVKVYMFCFQVGLNLGLTYSPGMKET